jgi:hypothetical protein
MPSVLLPTLDRLSGVLAVSFRDLIKQPFPYGLTAGIGFEKLDLDRAGNFHGSYVYQNWNIVKNDSR